MAQRWRIYAPLMLFMGFVAMLGSAYSAWMPSLVTRNFDIPLPKLGAQVGAVMILCFPSGMVLSGLAVDLLRKRGVWRAPGYIGIAAMLLVGFPFVFLPLAPNLPLMWAASYAGMFCLAFAVPIGMTITAAVAPRAAAGRVQAVCLLVQALIGQAGGPVLIGYLSDTAFAWAGRKSLAYALSACCAGLTACGLVCIILVTRQLMRAPLPDD
jgi:MFS family permease